MHYLTTCNTGRIVHRADVSYMTGRYKIGQRFRWRPLNSYCCYTSDFLEISVLSKTTA